MEDYFEVGHHWGDIAHVMSLTIPEMYEYRSQFVSLRNQKRI